MLANLLLLVAAPLVAGQAPPAVGTQLTYRGTLTLADADQQAASRKSLELTCWISAAEERRVSVDWLLDEAGHGQFGWSERFGSFAASDQGLAGGNPPALLYARQQESSVVPVPLPLIVQGDPPAAGVTWSQQDQKLQIEQQVKRGDRSCWQIALSDAFGPRGTIWLAADGPIVAALEQRVIMGRGEEYKLKLELTGQEVLDPAAAAALHKASEALGTLRSTLNRPRRSAETDWKPQDLAALEQGLPAAEAAAAGTPLEKITAAAQRDLKLQTGRSGALAELAGQFQGQPAEKFSIAGFGDEKLSSGDLSGEVTVLHFWEYRDEPLKEPYGQVGYLDFIHHRRPDVRLYGVAVDGRLAEDKTRPAAERSVRKFKEFMNLSFPVLLDSGPLVKKFGDPRVLGASLPLFVVIGRDGKIAHYHVGHYDVHQDQGLQELDAAVVAELQKKR